MKPLPFRPHPPRRPLTAREQLARVRVRAGRVDGGLAIDLGTPAPVVRLPKRKPKTP